MSNSIPRIALPAVLTAAVAACSSVSTREPAAHVAPPRQLLSAGSLSLPRDCAVPAGVVYRADFVVGPDGAVETVVPGEGPECAQVALAQWVRTFRYEGSLSPATTTIDWMVVTGR
jgi:hypothetical protein